MKKSNLLELLETDSEEESQESKSFDADLVRLVNDHYKTKEDSILSNAFDDMLQVFKESQPDPKRSDILRRKPRLSRRYLMGQKDYSHRVKRKRKKKKKIPHRRHSVATTHTEREDPRTFYEEYLEMRNSPDSKLSSNEDKKLNYFHQSSLNAIQPVSKSFQSYKPKWKPSSTTPGRNQRTRTASEGDLWITGLTYDQKIRLKKRKEAEKKLPMKLDNGDIEQLVDRLHRQDPHVRKRKLKRMQKKKLKKEMKECKFKPRLTKNKIYENVGSEDDLYTRQKKLLENKKKFIEEQRRKKKESIKKKYSFKPSLNKKSLRMVNNVEDRKKGYDRFQAWISAKKNHIEAVRSLNERKKEKMYTFAPNTCSGTERIRKRVKRGGKRSKRRRRRDDDDDEEEDLNRKSVFERNYGQWKQRFIRKKSLKRRNRKKRYQSTPNKRGGAVINGFINFEEHKRRNERKQQQQQLDQQSKKRRRTRKPKMKKKAMKQKYSYSYGDDDDDDDDDNNEEENEDEKAIVSPHLKTPTSQRKKNRKNKNKKSKLDLLTEKYLDFKKFEKHEQLRKKRELVMKKKGRSFTKSLNTPPSSQKKKNKRKYKIDDDDDDDDSSSDDAVREIDLEKVRRSGSFLNPFSKPGHGYDDEEEVEEKKTRKMGETVHKIRNEKVKERDLKLDALDEYLRGMSDEGEDDDVDDRNEEDVAGVKNMISSLMEKSMMNDEHLKGI